MQTKHAEVMNLNAVAKKAGVSTATVSRVLDVLDQGARVPEDMSVTGFDNIKLAEFCSPALTTAHIPREQIGQLIFENLAPHSMKEQLTGREILIDPELVVRESTGRARNPRPTAGQPDKIVADCLSLVQMLPSKGPLYVFTKDWS